MSRLRTLGFAEAAGGDEVFQDLVLARIIEPTSKQDSLRVLAETGIEPVWYRTIKLGRRSMPSPGGASSWPRPAPRTPGSDRPPW